MGGASAEAPAELRLHSSLRGIAAAFSTPVLLGGLGGWVLATRGLHPVPLGLVVLATVLAAVVLADYPLSSRFAADGIERRCPLRRHHLAWDGIDALQRAAGSRLRRRLVPVAGEDEGAGPRRRLVASPGGLVAVRGRRRYLLVDQPESPEEHDVLLALVAAAAPGVAVVAPRPPAGVPPTWLYRRRPPR